MENSLNDELLCSLKDELREVTAQINVHSEKLMDLLDQKKESSVNLLERCRVSRLLSSCIGKIRSNMSLLCSMPSIRVG